MVDCLAGRTGLKTQEIPQNASAVRPRVDAHTWTDCEWQGRTRENRTDSAKPQVKSARCSGAVLSTLHTDAMTSRAPVTPQTFANAQEGNRPARRAGRFSRALCHAVGGSALQSGTTWHCLSSRLPSAPFFLLRACVLPPPPPLPLCPLEGDKRTPSHVTQAASKGQASRGDETEGH